MTLVATVAANAERDSTFYYSFYKGSQDAFSPLLPKKITRSLGSSCRRKRRFAAVINDLDAAGQSSGVREPATLPNILIVGGMLFPRCFCRIYAEIANG